MGCPASKSAIEVSPYSDDSESSIGSDVTNSSTDSSDEQFEEDINKDPTEELR